MKVTSQTRAARALLAYFNHSMVVRIVRKVMAESDPAARKRFANAIMDLIPKAVGETLYGRVVHDVERRADAYINSAMWAHRVGATLELNGQRWADEAIQQALADRARSYVNAQMKSWEMAAFTKSLTGRLQSAIEDEMRKAAAQAAQAAAQAEKGQG